MPTAFSVSRYARSARLLHWLMALLVILAYVLITNRGQFERGSLERQWVVLSHFWVGLLVLLLVLPRLWVRHRHPVPPITPPLAASLEAVGRLTHYALYGFLLAQPLLGLFTVWLTIGAVKIPSSTWALPSPFAVNPELAKSLKGVHVWLGQAFYWVIGLHVLAALWHHLIRRDDTLKRML
ncbi:cytochrome B561 [Pseudomonas oryzihabitans]|uniref:cytochrome b n=1 Tax=Pseudomonas rhizoryzae TaxID=2571129 RepID=UPI0007375569|nr:cytochrome b [Pseudomonas rhizoryzae]APQ11823.1 cytochrome B [Pseudomonas psychrotolerans]KTS76308.1 cytochrome B561 [Pseudomonas psychrotolerans]KTT36507.1 cytochrome B561 [Pseudomonas psychrotolerans]KTT78341.1 cytochrome B561 [Pseudomonas psychrotolerans]